MPSSDPTFNRRLSDLRAALVVQGRRVQRQIEGAVDSVFGKDGAKALGVIESDGEIDREDVRIEREAVDILTDALDRGVKLDHHTVRMILTIVKVNNEFERISDCAVNIAERIDAFMGLDTEMPRKFQMMANSVIGIMRTTTIALESMDTIAAQLVLASDDATEAFKDAILRDTEQQLVRGEHSVDYAFALRTVAVNLGRMTDHCTNVAEQVIYVESGKIVRHQGDRWTSPEPAE